MMGLEPAKLADLSVSFFPSVFGYGANCGIGASELIGSLICFKSYKSDESMILVAKANCGIPVFKGDKITYNGTPEMMAQYARYAIDMGAKIIGGCCGTTHFHIKAMSESLKNYNPSSQAINVDKIISDLGSMTEGNKNMISNYINQKPSNVDSKRRRKRRRTL